MLIQHRCSIEILAALIVLGKLSGIRECHLHIVQWGIPHPLLLAKAKTKFLYAGQS
jgi:hypothetical protein